MCLPLRLAHIDDGPHTCALMSSHFFSGSEPVITCIIDAHIYELRYVQYRRVCYDLVITTYVEISTTSQLNSNYVESLVINIERL